MWNSQDKIDVHHTVGAILTYSSIILGFSITSVTLILNFSDTRFLKYLIFLRISSDRKDGLSELIFVFFWCCFINGFLCVVSIFYIFIDPRREQIYSTNFFEELLLSVIAFLSAYSILQFIVSLTTIVQFANAYVSFRQNNLDRERQKLVIGSAKIKNRR